MNKININGKDFTVEELNKLIEQSKTENIVEEKEKLFIELFHGLKIWTNIEKYPDSVFYFRNERRVLQKRKDKLYVDYLYIWSFFEKNFGMKPKEIQSFIKEMVEKHFKWMGLTPFQHYTDYSKEKALIFWNT